MLKLLLILLTSFITLNAIDIVQKPIHFSDHRKALTLEYIQQHYGLTPQNIEISPKIILVHHTAIETLEGSFRAFDLEELPSSRSDIAGHKASVNVSVAYLVDKNGTIYQLMPDNWMGRHVIGLNYSSIGIENVGSLKTLTQQQIRANIALINYLKQKYPDISYLVPHSDYRCFEADPLWLELDKGYRTEKEDPGTAFMQALYQALPDFKKAPCR